MILSPETRYSVSEADVVAAPHIDVRREVFNAAWQRVGETGEKVGIVLDGRVVAELGPNGLTRIVEPSA